MRVVIWRSLIVFIATMIFIPTLFPGVSAGVTGDADNWDEDGWLQTKIAEDRLAAGDEFGCYGFPGLSWQATPGDVATACRGYLEERISASRWSDNPVSIYTPSGLNYVQHEAISNVGFSVHGDETGLPNTAWHDANDTPTQVEDWYNLGRRGGSLESVIANQEEVESEAEMGGLLNFYWIGRVNDATVRHDRDLFTWLEETPSWSTTWGEAWSYWASQRCYELEYDNSIDSSDYGFSFEYKRPEACISQDERVWNVPLTWVIDLNGSVVNGVVSENGTIANFTGGEKILNQGWWQDGDIVYLTVLPNNPVEIKTNEEVVDFDIIEISENFNNHSFAVTIAGHATEDLFKWSKRFDDSDIRFTWLITPREGEPRLAWLPYLGVIVIIASVAGTYYLVKKDKEEQLKNIVGIGNEDE